MINKSFIAFLILFTCALSLQAYAQKPELFERPVPNLPSDIEQLLDEAPAEQKQFNEPTNISEFANQYYYNCTKQEHDDLSPDDLELLCACTAAKIPENMTMQNTVDMQTKSNEGKLQRIRFMEYIYTPCIRYPVAHLVEQRCLKDKEIKKKYRHEKHICACLGEKMGDYMDEKSPGFVNMAVRRALENVDPLEILLDSSQFTQRAGTNMNYCVDRYEYGKK